MIPSTELSTAFDAGLEFLSDEQGVKIDQSAQDALLRYLQLLAKWNKVYNLTAVRDPVAMVWRHLVDSLVLCRYLPDSHNVLQLANEADDVQDYRVIDIGSGAGLPVLPLAIARSQFQFMSIESNGKKTRFQQQVCLELDISNVDIVNQRVQDIKAQADFVISRAFTAPTTFLQIAHRLCSQDARVAIMLAHSDTLPEPLPLNFSLTELVPVDIPGSPAPRHVAICHYNA